VKSDLSTVERRGRSLGTLVFGLLIAVPTVVWATQVIIQAFDAPDATGLECKAGLVALLEGLDQARVSAHPAANEDDALSAFRQNLGAEWTTARRVRTACKGDPERLGQFGKIERLRYAEEHAVRYQTRGLSADRNAVDKIRHELQRPKP
jgi:hypothetical protein